MERFDIINYLVKINGYNTFLEIGTQKQINFSHIKIDYKVCVDPDPNANATYQMTSDDFFNVNKETFDIIFIDGLHHSDYVYRDIINSIKILNDGGVIVVHDCIPFDEVAQIIPLERASNLGAHAWNGDVWKSIIKLRTERSDLKIKVVDVDHGCCIIHPVDLNFGDNLKDFNNGYYIYDEKLVRDNLNIINYNQFIDYYREPIK